MTVVFHKHAAFSISAAAYYISEKGYPETAENYRRKLYAFGYSLAVFPDK